MSLFGWWNDSDDVFDDDDDEDDIGNEWDIPEEEIDEAVDQIKGKVNTGDCIYCKAKDFLYAAIVETLLMRILIISGC